MRYKNKQVSIPQDMIVGSEVGILGEGMDTQIIEQIVRCACGVVTDIHLSGGWREPLCKICLIRDGDFAKSWEDPTCWIQVAIGECDICGKKFPDSCIYHSSPDKPDSMICQTCHKASEHIVGHGNLIV